MKTLLHIIGLNKHYGERVIFEDASAALLSHQKIGFIGRNGAGKSTLCRMITGDEAPDSGQVRASDDLRLGYMRQHDDFAPEETALGFLIRSTGQEPWRCGKVGARFQLDDRVLDAAMASLPGGYRTRVKLASMLLQDPNFLVLDEPTNYLDLKTLLLFERFLQDFRGGALIVSHDREFLKRTCDHTLEAENGRLTMYPGTIDEYLLFKEEQHQQALSHNRNVELKQKQLQDFVDRFRAKASKATQAKSKMKQLARLTTIAVDHPLGNVRIRIPPVVVRGGAALRCEDLDIGYPDRVVAKGVNVEIQRGARVAILGDNGQGKTTFLKTIAGELSPLRGSFQWGHGVEWAYYAQHVMASLHPEETVLEHLENKAAPDVSRQTALDMAGCFLFKGDDVQKRIKTLSGGEGARLCLAGMLLSKRTTFLFDEPTNHLDFETVEALGQALKEYPGTVFFISHDRTFVQLVATEILEVKEGTIRSYPGTYEEYVAHLEARLEDDPSPDDLPATPPAPAPQKTPSGPARAKELKALEERIELYRKEKAELEQFFASTPPWSREKNERYQEVLKALADAEDAWLSAQ